MTFVLLPPVEAPAVYASIGRQAAGILVRGTEAEPRLIRVRKFGDGGHVAFIVSPTHRSSYPSRAADGL